VRRLLRRSQRPDLAWAGTMAAALQASVLVFLIGGGSLSAAYLDIDYLLVAMLAVLRDLVERALREPAPGLYDFATRSARQDVTLAAPTGAAADAPIDAPVV